MRSSAQNTDEKNKVQLTIDIREDELAPFVDQAIRKIGRQARIPGFRPGKAPRKVLEARIGQKALRQQAIDDAMETYYKRALLDNGVDAIAASGMEIVEGEDGGDVQVSVSVEVRPVVSVDGYDSIEIEIERHNVTEEDVDEYLKVLAEQVGQLKDVERPSEVGDTVTVDLVVLVNGVEDDTESVSDLTFRIGRNQVDPKIEDAVLGSAIGAVLEIESESDQSEIDQEIDNSDSDQVNPEDSNAGPKDHKVLKITIKSVKEMEIPDLTDELASEISEFETLSELKDDVRSELSKMRLSRARTAYRSLLVDSLLKLVELDDIPESLLRAEVDSQLHQFSHQLQNQGLSLKRYFELTNQDEQDLLGEVYGAASRNILFDLALRAVAYAEALEVDEDEIDAHISKGENRGDDSARSEEDRELERLDAQVELLKEKAFKVLLRKVKIKNTEGDVVDLAEIDPETAQELSEVSEDLQDNKDENEVDREVTSPTDEDLSNSDSSS